MNTPPTTNPDTVDHEQGDDHDDGLYQCVDEYGPSWCRHDGYEPTSTTIDIGEPDAVERVEVEHQAGELGTTAPAQPVPVEELALTGTGELFGTFGLGLFFVVLGTWIKNRANR